MNEEVVGAAVGWSKDDAVLEVVDGTVTVDGVEELCGIELGIEDGGLCSLIGDELEGRLGEGTIGVGTELIVA